IIFYFKYLHPTYKIVLLVIHFISIIIQFIRPFLGYSGNLKEKIPELSGFWILTALIHLPSQIFLFINSDIYQLPLEKYTILLEIILSIIEVI
ncbi:Transmembrane protein 17B, partial [Meloidogyne graminicola]